MSDPTCLPTAEPAGRSALLAVDVGGTTIKSALLGLDGRVLARQWVSTGRGDDAQEAVRDSARHLAGQALDLGVSLVGAGVVSPGVIDPEAGIVRYASNLDWTDVSLRALVASGVGSAGTADSPGTAYRPGTADSPGTAAGGELPVGVGHDARAAGDAEGLLGAARGVRDYVHISIGTGIAGSLVVGGRLVAGSAGGAGELGHAPVRPGGEECPCGQRGCLEVYASGGGIARRYLALTGSTSSAREVAERRATDPAAEQVWDEAVEAWVTSLSTLILVLEPRLIVLGGGLAQAGEALLSPIRSGLAAALTWREPPRVEASTLGGDAALTGAALLAARSAEVAVDAEEWLRHA